MLGVDVKRIVESSNHRLEMPDISLHIELCPKKTSKVP